MELKLEQSEGRLRATFEGEFEAVPHALCAELVATIREQAPRVVHLMCDFGVPGSSWPQALEGVTLPSVEAFIFDVFFQTQTRQGENSIGDLRATLVACPNLQRMFASGSSSMSPVEHANLRALHLNGDPLSPKLVDALGRCRFEQLERIAISLASDRGPIDGAPAIASLVAMHAPALTAVTLGDTESVETLLAAVAGVGRPWDLALGGSIDDEDALLAVIEEHVDALRKLTSLALPFADYTSTDAFERAQQLVPSITDTSYYDRGTLPATYERW
jgi:hypothetical protein